MKIPDEFVYLKKHAKAFDFRLFIFVYIKTSLRTKGRYFGICFWGGSEMYGVWL